MAHAHKQGNVGGVGTEQDINGEVKQYALDVQDDAEKKLGKTFSEYDPVSYAQQLVNGINYFIKVEVGHEQYIVVKVYKPFEGPVSFSGAQDGYTSLGQQIEYF